jgi:hypothetical protein
MFHIFHCLFGVLLVKCVDQRSHRQILYHGTQFLIQGLIDFYAKRGKLLQSRILVSFIARFK